MITKGTTPATTCIWTRDPGGHWRCDRCGICCECYCAEPTTAEAYGICQRGCGSWDGDCYCDEGND